MSEKSLHTYAGDIYFELKRDIRTSKSVICPRLIVPLTVKHDSSHQEYVIKELRITNIEFYAFKQFAGNIQLNESSLDFSNMKERETELYLPTNNYVLSKFEDLRNTESTQDFIFSLILHIETRVKFKGKEGEFSKNYDRVTIEHKIPQSEWIKFLRELNYKQVFLMEVPKLKNDDFAKALEYLEVAHTNLSKGDYSYKYIAVECQQAFEQAKKSLKEKGFVDKEKDNIDFKKLLCSDAVAEYVDTMFRKLNAFFQKTGRHSDYIAKKEYAEFSILLTHALLNIFIKATEESN
ncbi:MAG: hypothetical protein WC614_00290 [bacterium]